MVSAAKKKTKPSEDQDFIPMRRTRALLAETWDLWRESFEQSPTIAKRIITQGLTELHKAEKEIQHKAKAATTAIKKSAVKKVKATAKKKTKPKGKAKA